MSKTKENQPKKLQTFIACNFGWSGQNILLCMSSLFKTNEKIEEDINLIDAYNYVPHTVSTVTRNIQATKVKKNNESITMSLVYEIFYHPVPMLYIDFFFWQENARMNEWLSECHLQ